MFKLSSNFLTDHFKVVLILWILFVICVLCHTVFSVSCSLRSPDGKWLTSRLSCMGCFLVFFIFLYDFLGKGWYLIARIPDICLLFLIFYSNIIIVGTFDMICYKMYSMVSKLFKMSVSLF